MREIVAVRMHAADAATLAVVDRLVAGAGRPVICCVDERHGPVAIGPRARLGWSEATLDALGLLAHPRAGWMCGDYAYYLLRSALPGFDRYWLVEPDLLINAAPPAAFFDLYRDDDADLLAPGFGPASAEWRWHRTVAADYAHPHRCFFPVTRLSARAIDHLLAVRQRATALARNSGGRRKSWPNDEAFVASALVADGFACRDLQRAERPVYTAETLRFGTPHDAEALRARAPDGLIWHPVPPAAPSAPHAATLEVPTGAETLKACAEHLLREAERHAAGARPEAALEPLLLARAALAGADALGPAAEARLATVLRAGGGAPPVGSAHLVTRRARRGPLSIAASTDFALDAGLALPTVPEGFALPYSLDIAGRAMLLTLHPDPKPVLAAPFLYAAQHEAARVVLRVPFDRLDAAFGPPSPGARPILVFSIGRTGSTLLKALLGCATPRSFSEPDTASLLALKRQELRELGPESFDGLVHHALSPLFAVGAEAAPEAPVAIKFRSQVNKALPDFLRVFPQARFVFMLRRRRAWARSTYRSFRHAPELVARSLAGGLRAAAMLANAPVDGRILMYEDLVASPDAVLARLLGLDGDLPPHLAAKVAETMGRDSQGSTTLAREGTGKPLPDEQEWLAAFDEAWAAIREPATIARLGVELEQG